MPGRTSGLERDLNLVRRRWWLFIPFLLLGTLVSFALGSLAGEANAVASMQLETVVYDVFTGGDRGLRIFEAQSMTGDQRFKQEVIAATGDQNFDYARYSISLNPISVADGVARGVLTVSVKDNSKARAESLRQDFVDVFTKEYTTPDGLFRTRFIDKRKAVADAADKEYQASVKNLNDVARSNGVTLPLDDLSYVHSAGALVNELNRQEAALQADLAEVKAARDNIASGKYPAETNASIAAAALKTPLTGDPLQALAGRQATLEAAIASVRKLRLDQSDIALDPDLLKALDDVREKGQVRLEAYGKIANAEAAVTAAESNIDTSYSFSGGLAGTLIGRVAVAVAVTIVFGLIAIYTLEWLSQVRSKVAD
jgi:hypothetical protein